MPPRHRRRSPRSPFALKYSTNGGSTFTTYYYILNLQGDVVKLVQILASPSGIQEYSEVASYTYDAWGNILSSTGNMADINPLRYRGYYYDTETGFYYLQSRYYDPANHRFINADSLASTGQGFAGTNMFAYCNNNPVCLSDYGGNMAGNACTMYISDCSWISDTESYKLTIGKDKMSRELYDVAKDSIADVVASSDYKVRSITVSNIGRYDYYNSSAFTKATSIFCLSFSAGSAIKNYKLIVAAGILTGVFALVDAFIPETVPDGSYDACNITFVAEQTYQIDLCNTYTRTYEVTYTFVHCDAFDNNCFWAIADCNVVLISTDFGKIR